MASAPSPVVTPTVRPQRATGTSLMTTKAVASAAQVPKLQMKSPPQQLASPSMDFLTASLVNTPLFSSHSTPLRQGVTHNSVADDFQLGPSMLGATSSDIMFSSVGRNPILA